MRRGAVRLYLTGLFAVLVGLFSIYLGDFRSGTVCDTSSGTCGFHTAGTIEPVSTLVGAVFVLFGVFVLVKALRRRNIRGPASDKTPGDVGALLRAMVARDVRAYYTKPVAA